MYKLLEPYAKLVDFLGEALGDNVEVALHDITSKEQEIVAIANSHISGREMENYFVQQHTLSKKMGRKCL